MDIKQFVTIKSKLTSLHTMVTELKNVKGKWCIIRILHTLDPCDPWGPITPVGPGIPGGPISPGRPSFPPSPLMTIFYEISNMCR